MARNFSASTDYLRRNVAAVTAYPVSISSWTIVTDATSNNFDVFVGDKDVGGIFCVTAIRTDTAAAASHNSNFQQATVGTPSDNTWHQHGGQFDSEAHRAAVLDSTVGTANTTSIGDVSSSWDRTTLGRADDTSPSTAMIGSMAEVGVWGVSLSQNSWDALAEGFSPRMVEPGGLGGYWDLLEDVATEYMREGSGTAINLIEAGTVIRADHPLTIYPCPPVLMREAAAVGGGFQAAWARGSNTVLGAGAVA